MNVSNSGHVEGSERRQRILLPDMLDEYVDEDNPVRFIDAFVDKLSLKKLGFKHSVPSETGRPSYDPADTSQAIHLWIPEPDSFQQKARARVQEKS